MFDNLTTDDTKPNNNSGQSPLGSANNNLPDQSLGQVVPGNSFPAKPTILNNNTGAVPSTPLQQAPVKNTPPRESQPLEDIFSEAGEQRKPAVFSPKTSVSPEARFDNQTMAQIDPYTGELIKSKNKTIVFALMLISLMLVAILGWYAYRMFFSMVAPEIVELNSAPLIQVNTVKPEPIKEVILEPTTTTTTTTTTSPKNNNSSLVLDLDGDGLSDEEEERLGTSLELPDTDGDGLFDREEVMVYKTDPLDTDTDKDGYTDGLEVDRGFNPNGEGKLYNLEN